MGKNKKSSSKKHDSSEAGRLGLQEETRYGILAVIFFVIGLFFLLGSLGFGGVVGSGLYHKLFTIIGIGYFLIPLLLFVLSLGYFRSRKTNIALTNIIGSFLFLLSGLGLIAIAFPEKGGLLGRLIARPFVHLFDVSGSTLLLLAVFIISVIILFNTHPVQTLIRFKEWRAQRRNTTDTSDETSDTPVVNQTMTIPVPEEPSEQAEESIPDVPEEKLEKEGFFKKKKKASVDAGELDIPVVSKEHHPYTPPPLKILGRDSGKPDVGDIKAQANTIRRALQNFGIDVVMEEVSIGPSVTRYALKPAEGVRLSKILGLQKNLELALAASPVRIEAPIPGKSLVGIEVPNTAKSTVGLGTLLSSDQYQEAKNPLTMALGRDVSGNMTFANLAKMPHLLIAGATGSGKSVTIHALINSLLFRNGPQMLRMVMVDPKRVELTLYKGIPHLLTPVITDAKKAILALKWLVNEMDRRYSVLEAQTVRDIHSYHATILAPALEKNSGEELPETMPYIVVVIDELADIMSTYPRELEAGIVRLAQMSRAVGIHLILSTQRPSVNVITGLIKANIPARIALQVSSQIDSRTILDTSGAEKLLGAGDMLFMSGEMSKPQRVQSAFISEGEVKKIAEFLREHGDGDMSDMEVQIDLDTVSSGATSGDIFGKDSDSDDDDLYEEARETVMKAGKASTSYLQRKLRVGYARAARLMDLLEERGVIGPADGAKPREVIGGEGYGEEEEE